MRHIVIVFILLSLINIAYADEDKITITTYYPSPYGVYRNMRLYPSNEPTAGVDRGLMYYNQSDNMLKYRNDTGWVNITGGGGGGVSYTKYCYNDAVFGTPLCGTVVLGTQWLCDAGFTVQKSLGSWGSCGNSGNIHCFLPPGGSCGPGYSSTVVGLAYVCSQ
jgi:hypothetical protein